MNRTILIQLKRSIKAGLDDKACQIIGSYGAYLSKRDLSSIIRYMYRIKSYSYSIIRYIYYISPYRYVFDLFEDNRLLFATHGYPDIIEMLWSDDRVVQEFKRIENSPTAFSIRDTYYAARYILGNGSSRVVLFLLNKIQIRSQSMLDFALEKAAEKGYTDVVKLLCDSPYAELRPTICGNALKLACKYGFYEIVSILLKSRSYIYTGALDKAINISCENGDVEIVKLLLEDPRTNPAHQSNCLIYNACSCKNSNAAIVKLLLEDERVDPARYILNPITATDKFEVMQLLVEDGRYDTISRKNAICNLIRRHSMGVGECAKIIRLLLINKIDPIDLNYLIDYAKRFGHRSVVNMLNAAKLNAEHHNAEQHNAEQKNIETC